MGGSGNLPIGPGVWGFIAAFVLALALWLLMRNMNSRMRRMAYRERDRLEQEESTTETSDAADSTDAADATDGDGPTDGTSEAEGPDAARS